MRIIFIGTSSFGVPILKKLISLNKDIVAVITQPDRPSGRGKKIQATPIKTLAVESRLYLFQPEDINSKNAVEEIDRLYPDLIILVAYGQILSGSILRLPTLGCLNIHPSLLPEYKGPAPINWTIIRGEQETGITFLFMNEKIDAGDIIFQKKITILPDENFEQLSLRLANESANLLEGLIKSIEKEEYHRIPQPKDMFFYARKINKDDCRLNWNKKGIEIYNLIRGVSPSPGAFTEFRGKRIKINEANLIKKEEVNSNNLQQKPGVIAGIDKKGIIVITGDSNYIGLKRLTPAGSREMDFSEFINGYHVKSGDSFK